MKKIMYFVYILQSEADDSLYTGFTENIEKRLQEHNAGLNNSTVSKKPWQLIYYEAYTIKDDALGREKFLKSGRGEKYLDHQLKFHFQNKPRKTKEST